MWYVKPIVLQPFFLLIISTTAPCFCLILSLCIFSGCIVLHSVSTQFKYVHFYINKNKHHLLCIFSSYTQCHIGRLCSSVSVGEKAERWTGWLTCLKPEHFQCDSGMTPHSSSSHCPPWNDGMCHERDVILWSTGASRVGAL